jgi:ribose transport system substrate-binding protein
MVQMYHTGRGSALVFPVALSVGPRILHQRAAVCLALLAAFLIGIASLGCRRARPIVAVIPRTCGTALWEPEHAGAAAVARARNLDLYWNAPMRDDDIQMQISLIEKSVARGYAGIIVAPIETLPMRTPMRRVLAHGVPVVVVDTELGIPPGPQLSYVMNDEMAGGRMAARRIGSILAAHGDIAIMGINPPLMSNTARERSFEDTLSREFPGIHVTARKLGLSSVPQEQQVAEQLLSSGDRIDAIVALSLASTRGAYYALVEFGREKTVRLVGFDQDLIPPIRTGGIDSVVIQNTYQIGRIAMDLMDREIDGKGGSAEVLVQPLLMTRDNVDAPEVRQILNLSWWSTR